MHTGSNTNTNTRTEKKTIKLLSNVCKFVPPNWIVAHAFCLNIRNTLMRGAWLAYVLDAFVLNASNHTFSPHSHAQQRIYSFFAISQKKGEYFGISRCWTATKKQHLFLYCCRTIFRLQFDFEMIAFFGMHAVCMLKNESTVLITINKYHVNTLNKRCCFGGNSNVIRFSVNKWVELMRFGCLKTTFYDIILLSFKKLFRFWTNF